MTLEPVTPSSASDKSSGVSVGRLLVIAIVVLVIYFAVSFFLYAVADNKEVTENVWARYVFLFGGLEAIVFTAVGWLFGREVNRKQAEQAKEATDDAKNSAKEAASAKATGQALKSAILTNPAVAGGAIGPAAAGGAGGAIEALRAQAEATEF